jgi:hypothetical protein
MKAALIDHISGDGLAPRARPAYRCQGRVPESLRAHILKPRGMDHKVMFTGPTGANAVEAAMKIARKVTGRTNIIAFTNGFHGVTLGRWPRPATAITAAAPGIALNGVTRMPYRRLHGREPTPPTCWKRCCPTVGRRRRAGRDPAGNRAGRRRAERRAPRLGPPRRADLPMPMARC